MQEIQDADGNYTGEYSPEYDAPQKVMVNVSPATGKDAIDIFGTDELYDKVIVVDWKTSVVYSPRDYDGAVGSDDSMLGIGQIDNNTVWFVDKSPTGDSPDGYDYIVQRIAQSINGICIALKKINNE